MHLQENAVATAAHMRCTGSVEWVSPRFGSLCSSSGGFGGGFYIEQRNRHALLVYQQLESAHSCSNELPWLDQLALCLALGCHAPLPGLAMPRPSWCVQSPRCTALASTQIDRCKLKHIRLPCHFAGVVLVPSARGMAHHDELVCAVLEDFRRLLMKRSASSRTLGVLRATQAESAMPAAQMDEGTPHRDSHNPASSLDGAAVHDGAGTSGAHDSRPPQETAESDELNLTKLHLVIELDESSLLMHVEPGLPPFMKAATRFHSPGALQISRLRHLRPTPKLRRSSHR